MKVKEVYVTRENPAEIFSLIENELLTEPDTQIFIDNKIYKELKTNNSDYNISQPNCPRCFHYHEDRDGFDGIEKWMALTQGGPYDKVIAIGSFASNTKEYMQLVQFRSSKVKEYMHYMEGFQQLLLILFRPE